MKITSVYIYIPVSDLGRSAAWYEEHLGLRPVHKDPLFWELRSDNGSRVLLISNGNGVTSQMDYDGAPQAVYGFTVSDISAAYQDLSAKGVAVGKVSNYAGTSFSFKDPDGNRIELWGDYPLS